MIGKILYQVFSMTYGEPLMTSESSVAALDYFTDWCDDHPDERVLVRVITVIADNFVGADKNG